MKILLIDLGDNRKENNEPIGIECIATHIECNSNHKVDIQWFNINDSIESISKYDVVGISLNIGNMQYFDNIYNSMNLKQKVVVGGNIPTFAYENLLEKYDRIICSIGEGEETFLNLIQFFEEKSVYKSLCNIPNIAYKIGDKIYETIREPFDLNKAHKLQHRREIINKIKSTNGIVRIEGSRGCSWRNCSFCCVNAKYANPKWRGFSIEKITDELIELSDLGVLSPYFTDEDFYGNNADRVQELSEKIIELKSGGKINPLMDFFISIMTNDINTDKGRDVLKLLRDAGLREVFMGIESMGSGQLKRFKKKALIEQNMRAIEFVKDLGLQVDLGFILFDPEMIFDELVENVEYIDSLQLNKYDSRSIKRLRLQPKTVYTIEYIDGVNYSLDINNLEYPYKFKDIKVNNVYFMYEEWENEFKEKIWKYQALTRGEAVSERLILKKQLGKIRDIDFNALKLIVSYINHSMHQKEYEDNITRIRREKIDAMSTFEKVLKSSGKKVL